MGGGVQPRRRAQLWWQQRTLQGGGQQLGAIVARSLQLPGADGTAFYAFGAPADVARLGLVRSFQISAVFPKLTALANVRVALQRRAGVTRFEHERGMHDDDVPRGRHRDAHAMARARDDEPAPPGAVPPEEDPAEGCPAGAPVTEGSAGARILFRTGTYSVATRRRLLRGWRPGSGSAPRT